MIQNLQQKIKYINNNSKPEVLYLPGMPLAPLIQWDWHEPPKELLQGQTVEVFLPLFVQDPPDGPVSKVSATLWQRNANDTNRRAGRPVT